MELSQEKVAVLRASQRDESRLVYSSQKSLSHELNYSNKTYFDSEISNYSFRKSIPQPRQARKMIFVFEALSVVLISGVKLGAWWLAFNWLSRC